MRQISRNYRASMVLALMAGAYRTEAVEGNTGPSAAPDAPVAPAELTAEQKAEADKQAEAAKQELHKAIKASFDNKVDIKESSFHFRKVTDEATKLVTKRPTVVLPIPVPSVEGIIAILESGAEKPKSLELLLEACAAVILEQAREYINEHEDVSEANFPFSNMAWDFIANLPKAERRGGGISKEVWEDFQKDYIDVMPSVTGKSLESVTLAAKVFANKFAGSTTNKPVLKLLQGYLAQYVNATTQGEQFAPCVEFLSNKLDKLLNTDETNLLLAL